MNAKKPILKEKYTLLKTGKIEIDEFMYTIVKDYERIEKEITKFSELYLHQWEMASTKKILEDNVKKTALLLAITELERNKGIKDDNTCKSEISTDYPLNMCLNKEIHGKETNHVL